VRYAFTKENSTCYVFVNIKFNGILKSARTAKIRGFDTFRDVNHEWADSALVTVSH